MMYKGFTINCDIVPKNACAVKKGLKNTTDHIRTYTEQKEIPKTQRPKTEK